MKQEEEKCCGNCCWFYDEMTDGDGFCIMQKGEIDDVMYCGSKCCDLFVSRQEMRHYMVVLLKEKRWKLADGWHTGKIVLAPSNEDVLNALSFAYKYMKVFSKL